MIVPWTYKGEVVNTLPKGSYGFIYCIHYNHGYKKYIGKKKVTIKVTKPARLDGKRRQPDSSFIKKRVKLTKEDLNARIPSDKRTSKLETFETYEQQTDSWKKYEGSCKADVSNYEITKKEILYFTNNKRTLTYLETQVLFKTHACVSDKFLNENIEGRFFDNALDGWIKEPTINE